LIPPAGTVTPLLAWLAVKRLVLDPYQARQRDQERQRRREANREKVNQSIIVLGSLAYRSQSLIYELRLQLLSIYHRLEEIL
jgi:hypothetical protein